MIDQEKYKQLYDEVVQLRNSIDEKGQEVIRGINSIIIKNLTPLEDGEFRLRTHNDLLYDKELIEFLLYNKMIQKRIQSI